MEVFDMLLPSIFGENLLDDWFDFPDMRGYDQAEKKLYGRHANRLMKTDVKEHEDHYEMDIDLPGFKKEDIHLELENGYLTVSAAKGLESEQKDEKQGRIIRQERYTGSMQRSFYIGDALREEDIKAKFEHGVLSLNIPKRAKEIPAKKTIMIEG